MIIFKINRLHFSDGKKAFNKLQQQFSIKASINRMCLLHTECNDIHKSLGPNASILLNEETLEIVLLKGEKQHRRQLLPLLLNMVMDLPDYAMRQEKAIRSIRIWEKKE